MSDEQDRAEALDDDVVDDDGGDGLGERPPDYPPERPMGVGTVGVTAVEEDAGESFAERTLREVPDDVVAEPPRQVGRLVDPDATSLDAEEELIGEAGPGDDLSAEEAAMHIEPDR